MSVYVLDVHKNELVVVVFSSSSSSKVIMLSVDGEIIDIFSSHASFIRELINIICEYCQVSCSKMMIRSRVE
jgi:hypothetical protein